jgi:hypothetical protein
MRLSFRGLVRIITCLIVSVLTLELCARIDDWIGYGAPIFSLSYNENRLYEYDQIGKRSRPNVRYRKWQLNSVGSRGPELTDGGTRILCLGASETFGLYEPEGQEYPRQLERQLNARIPGGDFQVLNFALPGMPLPVITTRIPAMAAAVHPRFALIYAGVATYIWLPDRKPLSSPPRDHFEWRLAEPVRNLAKQLIPASLQDKFRERSIQQSLASLGTPAFDRLPQENLDYYRSDLEDLIATLRRYDIEPILVTHATRFPPEPTPADRPMLLAWRRFGPLLREDGFLPMERSGNDILRQLAAADGLFLIDAASRIPTGDRYFADFVHFTEEGSRQMADVLADALVPRLAADQSR